MPQGFVIRLTMMNANVGTSQLWHQLRVPDSPARCMTGSPAHYAKCCAAGCGIRVSVSALSRQPPYRCHRLLSCTCAAA